MNDDLKYLPDAWLDEVVPETKAHPDEFILAANDGAYFLGYPKGHVDADNPFYRISVKDGQQIGFSTIESFGTWEVKVGEGGKPIAPEGYPLCASHHFIDNDTFGDSLEEIFQMALKFGELPDVGETIDVHAYTWGDSSWRFFTKPKPHFEEERGGVQ